MKLELAAIELAATERKPGSLGWSSWTTRLAPAEAEKRLDQLVHLGDSWVGRRDAFRRLLTTGQS